MSMSCRHSAHKHVQIGIRTYTHTCVEIVLTCRTNEMNEWIFDIHTQNEYEFVMRQKEKTKQSVNEQKRWKERMKERKKDRIDKQIDRQAERKTNGE